MIALSNEQIEELLPFYVNGSLSDEETEAVAANLAANATLSVEADALKNLRASMQAEEVRSPGEFGLARIMRTIDSMDKTAAPSSGGQWFWKAAAVAAFAALIGQQVLNYEPTQEMTLVGAPVEAELIVAFRPVANEQEIRDLLLTHNLEIVNGPSALGLYQLKGADDVDLAEVLQALADASNIVETVENVDQ